MVAFPGSYPHHIGWSPRHAMFSRFVLLILCVWFGEFFVSSLTFPGGDQIFQYFHRLGNLSIPTESKIQWNPLERQLFKHLILPEKWTYFCERTFLPPFSDNSELSQVLILGLGTISFCSGTTSFSTFGDLTTCGDLTSLTWLSEWFSEGKFEKKSWSNERIYDLYLMSWVTYQITSETMVLLKKNVLKDCSLYHLNLGHHGFQTRNDLWEQSRV